MPEVNNLLSFPAGEGDESASVCSQLNIMGNYDSRWLERFH